MIEDQIFTHRDEVEQQACYEAVLSYLQGRIDGFDPWVPRCLLALGRAYDRVDRCLNSALAAWDLSLAGFNVLVLLYRTRGMPLKDLSSNLIRTPANITGLVDGLVRKGLVKREPHPQDRRCKLAVLLPAGKELLEQILPLHHRLTSRLLSGLSTQDKQSLCELLERLNNSLDENSGGTCHYAKG